MKAPERAKRRKQPYIALELVAAEQLHAIGCAFGIDEDAIVGRMVRVWMHARRARVDRLTRSIVAGILKTNAIVEELIKAGFFVPYEGDCLMISGAWRWMELFERAKSGADARWKCQRNATGIPQAQNDHIYMATRVKFDTPVSTESAQVVQDVHNKMPVAYNKHPSGMQQARERRKKIYMHDHLTTFDDHAEQFPENATGIPPASSEISDGMKRKQLIADLVEKFSALRAGAKYSFGGRDAKAVDTLRQYGDGEEILRRWTRALRHTGYPSVQTLYELVKHWNHYAIDRHSPLASREAMVTHGEF